MEGSEEGNTIELSSLEHDMKPVHKMARLMLATDSLDDTDDQPTTLNEAIIDLYLSVKIRKDDESVNETMLNSEREHLQEIDPFVILEYIRNSFDILLNMKMEENKSAPLTAKRGSKYSNNHSVKTGVDTQFSNEQDNNDLE